MSNENREIQKLTLKIQALKESFATKVAEYEEKVADIRVEATMHLEALNQRVAELEAELGVKDAPVSQEDSN